MRIFRPIFMGFVLLTSVVLLVGLGAFVVKNFLPQKTLIESPTGQSTSGTTTSGLLTSSSDLTLNGILKLNGAAFLNLNNLSYAPWSGRVLSVDESGKIVLVPDKYGSTTTQTVTGSGVGFPTASVGSSLYYDGTEWKADTNLYNDGDKIGIFTSTPSANLHIDNNSPETPVLIVEGADGQNTSLTEWRDHTGIDLASIGSQGKLSINSSSNDHSIELIPTGNAGYLSSSGGAFFLNNTSNLGNGIGIYSNAGADALGNMINVKVDNTAYAQAAFYMDYDGNSNAVEIVSNSTDTSSNALAVTGNNPNDSTLGIIGFETGRGTIKVSHNGTGSDSNASGISIDLKGTGTRAQGLFVDSTASGGTSGNLLTLRNQTVSRFTVGSLGSVTIGSTGTDTSVTKQGNTTGDQFFIGTNGAFRVQRSATDSEAFRTQVNGDSQGRWLGTSDGKLKFGSGSATQDVVLSRTGVGLFQMATDVEIDSQSTSNDVLDLKASDGSELAKFAETSTGDGQLEIDSNTGTAVAVIKGDGTTSYLTTGNFAIGGTAVGTSGNDVFALYNGTAPASSITNGVQLFADDVAASSELRVRDEAGNVTTLSPHNFSLIPGGQSEDLAWSYYSEKDGTAVNVDILKALRIVENLSGQTLVYEKNLLTGEEIPSTTKTQVPPLIENPDDTTKTLIADAFDKAVSKEDFVKHVSLASTIWTFISDVIFKAKAVFENSVEFLASAVFKGPITVNADTSGSVTIPSNTKKFSITFAKSFQKTPVIYGTFKDSDVRFVVSNITQSGFEVSLGSTNSSAVEFSWLALMSEDDSFDHLKVLETSAGESNVVVETPKPEPEPSAVLSDPEPTPVATVSSEITVTATESGNIN